MVQKFHELLFFKENFTFDAYVLATTLAPVISYFDYGSTLFCSALTVALVALLINLLCLLADIGLPFIYNALESALTHAGCDI